MVITSESDTSLPLYRQFNEKEHFQLEQEINIPLAQIHSTEMGTEGNSLAFNSSHFPCYPHLSDHSDVVCQIFQRLLMRCSYNLFTSQPSLETKLLSSPAACPRRPQGQAQCDFSGHGERAVFTQAGHHSSLGPQGMEGTWASHCHRQNEQGKTRQKRKKDASTQKQFGNMEEKANKRFNYTEGI